MAFNGAGTFVRLYNWVVDRDAAVPITASRMDAEMDGMATGLSTCLTKDGQTTATAIIPFALGATFGAAATPATNDGAALGSTSLKWADLFLASGGVINFNNGDVSITHSANTLAFGGASNGYTFDASILPGSNDGAALGSTSLMFSDVFLASGAVINFNNGDVSITHSANTLAFGGASNGYTFDASILPGSNDGAALGSTSLMFSDLFLASGSVINWNNGDVTATHSSNTLTFAGASSGYVFDALFDISGAAAGQIKFPGTQNASSNVNTLDDYEEGTFTPGLTFGGGSTGMTFSSQIGTYTKIGNRVYYSFYLVLSAKGSSTGAASCTGLPFTSNTSISSASGYINVSNSLSNPVAIINAGAAAITPHYFSSGNVATMTHTDFNNTTSIAFSGSYQTA